MCLGERLFVHLIGVDPGDGDFPTDELLAYDVELTSESEGGGAERLKDLGLLHGRAPIGYGDSSLPTFFIRERTPKLHLLHASCRMLHGKGEDSLLSGDEVVAQTARDVAERPSALFLTGDQIYADDVAGPIIKHVRRLGTDLMGGRDDGSVPDMPPLSEIEVYGRADLISQKAKFTSEHGSNHLMSFGEFAAMYVTAWNERMWPREFERPDAVISGRSPAAIKARRKYATEIEDLERARAALPAVRRVLANVPTYMVFDDHDITDDWNITAAWHEAVSGSPSGRRIVANALAAYWAFQGWGNDPEGYDPEFKKIIGGFLAGDGTVDAGDFESALWSFDRWSFSAPTRPVTIALDTRTQRSYDSPDGAARLLSDSARERVLSIARGVDRRPGDTMILVSPVPVYGLELQERRQKFLAGKVGPYEIDFEAWHSNLQGFVDFMHLLVEGLELSSALLLSGDIHYGCNAAARMTLDDKQVSIVQLVSSSEKHSGVLSKSALNLLGRLVKKKHERVGWDRAPRVEGASRLEERALTRPVNTDEWNDDSPVFVSPREAERLGSAQPPRYREERTYVRPSEELSSMLVGDNNLGLVSLEDDEVVHRLLARVRGRTHVHTARMSLRHGTT